MLRRVQYTFVHTQRNYLIHSQKYTQNNHQQSKSHRIKYKLNIPLHHSRRNHFHNSNICPARYLNTLYSQINKANILQQSWQNNPICIQYTQMHYYKTNSYQGILSHIYYLNLYYIHKDMMCIQSDCLKYKSNNQRKQCRQGIQYQK